MQKEQKLANDKLILEQAVIRFQNEQVALQTEIKSFHQQLADKQERIDELQSLNQQAQNNLDRYREGSREQRLKKQQHESQIKYFEQSTQQYFQENYHRKGQLRFNHEILKKYPYTIIAQLNDMKSQLTITQDTLVHSEKSEDHWKMQHRDNLIQLENRKKIIFEL